MLRLSKDAPRPSNGDTSTSSNQLAIGDYSVLKNSPSSSNGGLSPTSSALIRGVESPFVGSISLSELLSGQLRRGPSSRSGSASRSRFVSMSVSGPPVQEASNSGNDGNNGDTSAHVKRLDL